MWWHGGAGLTERSERGSLSAVATHDVFCLFEIEDGKRLKSTFDHNRSGEHVVKGLFILGHQHRN